MELSKEIHKPILIHNVRSSSDLLGLKSQYPSNPWIIHDYNGNSNQTKDFVRKNCYFSFGPRLISSGKLQIVFKELLNIYPERVFFETDEDEIEKIFEVYNTALKLGNYQNIQQLQDLNSSNLIQLLANTHTS